MNPVKLFEEEFRKYVKSRYAIAVCNGTAALHSSLLALGAEPGDKVITTAYTFPATVNSILMCGATPVFADIEPNGYNINLDSIQKQLEKHSEVTGIIPVHLFGKPCNMQDIMKLASDYNVWVLEDASQAIGAEYQGKKLGTIGIAGTYSFYASKNLPAYEGGMIATDSPELERETRLIRNHGLNEKGLMVRMGYNYKMPWSNAFHGWQYLLLHKPAVEAELGRYGPEDGYYPRVVYSHPYYVEKGIRGDCPNAERLAEKVRRMQSC